jgi:hypothetical protein
MPGVGYAPGSWEERARRAEAERDAARVTDLNNRLELRVREEAVGAAIAAARNSLSWRITAPLRRLARIRARVGARSS